MNYWLTTHWPPREGAENEVPSGVWLPDGRQQAGRELRGGDPVLIYQSATGRTEIEEKVDGATREIHSIRGKEGIIAIVRATQAISRNPNEGVSKYKNGTSIWWCWSASTELLSTNGFVSRRDLNKVLGYRLNYNLRGFGDFKSGLKKLSKAEYESLVELFKRNSKRSDLIDRALRHKHKPSVHPTGGESNSHCHLKKLVASDPSTVLGEAGLSTVEVESAFPTGDRADIVLQDAYGRIIGVEIEVDVGDLDIEGALQAIKYRAMLEVTNKRPAGQGRAFLVAYSISDEMRTICREYGVECFKVPMPQT